MDCYFINLAAQTDRRAAIESNFDSKKIDGWRLSRFDAVNVEQLDSLNVPGRARSAEKACYLSHKALLKEAAGRDDPIMIMEDDAVIGARTCRAIEVGLDNIDPAGWDILFTDVCVPNVGAWADLIRLRRQFMKSGELRFLDLSQIQFAGTTSYIVNPRSASRIYELIENIAAIEMGYDLYLQAMTHAGAIRASVFVPFVTSISSLSEHSSIQSAESQALRSVLDLFRRMIWLDRDLAAHSESVAAMAAAYDNVESRMFGVLFEAMISETLQWN